MAKGEQTGAMTREQLEQLEAAAVPSVGLAITPTGDVLVRGRHPLGLGENVVRVAAADVLRAAHAIALAAVASARGGLASRGD